MLYQLSYVPGATWTLSFLTPYWIRTNVQSLEGSCSSN
jgi:hypothetical protein